MQWALIEPLLESPYSHLHAGVLGWQRRPEPVEAAVFWWADAYLAMHRGKGQVAAEPLPRPWETPRAVAQPRQSEAEKQADRTWLAERLTRPTPK